MKRNSGIIGLAKIVNTSTASGIHDTFDQYNYRKNSSWPLTVTYAEEQLVYTLAENASLSLTIRTTALLVNTTLYWTILHGTTSNTDFYGSVVSGSFAQTASTQAGYPAIFTAFTGNTAKTPKTFQIQIRTGSISGPVVLTTNVYTINTLVISTLAWSPTSVNEGSSSILSMVLTNCGTYNFVNLNLTYSGTATPSTDFTISLPSVVTVSTSGNFTVLNLTASADLTTEGTETLGVQISYGGYNIGTVQTLTINDTSLALTATVTPSLSTVVEGNSVTFNVTASGSYTGTLYYSINSVSGTAMTTARFTDALLTGSITMTSGAGSISKTVIADGVSQSSVYSLSVRSVSVTGTILVTSTNVTVTDAAAPAGYTLTAGTKVPTLGAASTGTWPPSGWTSLQNVNADDASVTVPFPFNFIFNNTTYTSCFPGSNLYITFGSGSSAYSGLSASNPAINKIMFNAADRGYQRVAYLSTANYTRIRFEGSSGTSATPGASNVICEYNFFNSSQTNGVPKIEFLMGNNATIGSGISGIYSASALLTAWTPAANQSYVFTGNSTGTIWTVSTGYYMAGTGY